MRPLSIVPFLAAAAVLTGAPRPATPAPAGMAPKLPTIEGRPSLATVGKDSISVDAFMEQLGLMHQGVVDEPAVKVRRQEPFDLLERLINIKLVLQEARTIGLDADPGLKGSVAAYRREAMGMILLQRRAASVKAADPASVRAIYEAQAREARVSSYLVEKEEDAKSVADRIKAGGNLDTVAKPLVASGKARAGEQGTWLKVGDMLPQVRSMVETSRPGTVSAPIKVTGGFAFIRLDEVRVSEDPVLRRDAERRALEQQRDRAVQTYTASLVKRMTRVDEKLLDRLDYETAKGLTPFLSDTRSLARIEGDSPVTVKDLTEAMLKKYYHGAEKAIAQKKVNARKRDALNEILAKRALFAEARRQRIDQTPEYRTTVKEYEEGVLFGAFVERVIDPDIKVGDPELRAYLAAHAPEFSSPEMMRLDGLAFVKRTSAEDALAKLRKGDDFAWMRGNAPGQAPPGSEGVMSFDPHPVVTSSLPADMRKALTGAAAGDYRLTGSGNGPYYVILVREIIPSRPQPFEDIRETLAKKAFEDKREKGVEEWAKKLRSAYPVKTYVTPETLGAILRAGGGPAGGVGPVVPSH